MYFSQRNKVRDFERAKICTMHCVHGIGGKRIRIYRILKKSVNSIINLHFDQQPVDFQLNKIIPICEHRLCSNGYFPTNASRN